MILTLLNALIAEFRDIFSYSVKGKAMDVPPMEFTVDRAEWENNLNRLDTYLLRNTTP